MQETTKARLTVFARLWAIPMILFIVLAVVAAIAGMEERTNLMGVAVLGTVLMLIVQFCQLIAAIVVRRWWCVAGSVIGILISLFVMICAIVALAAGQYRPPAYANDSIDVEVEDSAVFMEAEEQQQISEDIR